MVKRSLASMATYLWIDNCHRVLEVETWLPKVVKGGRAIETLIQEATLPNQYTVSNGIQGSYRRWNQILDARQPPEVRRS